MKTTVEKISDQFNITKKLAKEVVDATIASIEATLVTEGKIRISGIGTLKVVNKPARKGRNPKTGEILTIAERKVVKFTALPTLKTAVQ